MSKDMAQRSVVIKLDRPEFSATWKEDVRGYIRANRGAILADVRDALLGPKSEIVPTRWGEWESEVLAATHDPRASQEVIADRQDDVDDDNRRREELTAFFAEQVRKAGHEEDERVRIPSADAARWVSGLEPKKMATNQATQHIKGLGASPLEHHCSNGWRGWIWTGAKCHEGSPTADLYKPARTHPKPKT
jgi:hypothetical protein